MIINIVLTKEDELEMRIKKQQEEEPEKVNPEGVSSFLIYYLSFIENNKEREAVKKLMDHVSDLALKNNGNPKKLLELVHLMSKNNRVPRVLQFAARTFQAIVSSQFKFSS